MGIGAFMIVMGAIHALVLAPALFWLRGDAPVATERKAARATGIGMPAPLGT